MRLQAFLARSGAASSRRKAEDLISAGRVRVNGETAALGSKVSPQDTVLLDAKEVFLPTHNTYLVLNKPSGYLTTMSDDRGRPTVAELMPSLAGLVPVGRLDFKTRGLLLLTNDGGFANRVAHPSAGIEKEYEILLKRPARTAALERLKAGPDLDDGPMLPPKLERLVPDLTSFNLTVHEGRNRIIRRACAAVGLELASLRRVRVGPARLGNLPEGEVRPLRKRELERFKREGAR